MLTILHAGLEKHVFSLTTHLVFLNLGFNGLFEKKTGFHGFPRFYLKYIFISSKGRDKNINKKIVALVGDEDMKTYFLLLF